MLKKSIPHVITSLNLFCGFAAVVYSFDENKLTALIFIIAAMILDAMDGRMARLLGVEGDFGKELDSLADVVTFGVAPALLLYHVSFQDWGAVGLIIAALFPICGAIRLARFNTKTHKVKNSFVGLPITAAGAILALFAVNYHFFGTPFMLTLFFGLSFLMVSNMRFPSFKHIHFPKHTYVIVPLMIFIIYLISKWTSDKFSLLLFMPIPLAVLFVLTIAKRRRKKKEKVDLEETDLNETEQEEPLEPRL